MATSSISTSTPSFKKYTPSFINQLQAEWNEFMLEISHSTPRDYPITNDDAPVSPKKNTIKDALVESLNKFNFTSGGNILIPVPLHTLKKVFSPSKCNADDVFKLEFFNEIKDNLNLTSVTCQRLQKLLFSDDHEVSDFPSPTLPKNYRKSAPPKLFPKKNRKQESHKNDFIRIVNCFKNDKDENLQKSIQRNINDVQNNVEKNSNIPKTFERNANVYREIADDDENSCKKIVSTENPVRVTPGNVNARNTKQRKLLSTQKKRTRKNSVGKGKKSDDVENAASKNKEEKRYSSIYELRMSGGSESSSLFYTFKHPKKSTRPTVVFTYFNQGDLTKMYQIVKKLGFFDIENQVSSRTTHLVCGGSNKTVNLCKAIARGSWILDKQWIISSDEENRWLYEENFEKTDLSPANKENRLKRQKLGSSYRCDVFSSCGSMYVSKSCIQPSVGDLRELVLLGGGRLEEKPEKATYIIGYLPGYNCVKEIWVLNCILQCKLVDTNKYIKNK